MILLAKVKKYSIILASFKKKKKKWGKGKMAGKGMILYYNGNE